MAKGVEVLCFKPALQNLATVFPDMNMAEYKKACNMDERNYWNEGGQLHCTKTLAQGDECCNFHVTRIVK